MMTAVAIRALRSSDHDSIERIERRAHPTPWSRSMFASELAKASSICLGAFEEETEKLIGYLIIARYVDAVALEQGVQRPHAAHGDAEGEAERAGGGQADAQAGERAGPGTDNDRLDVGRLDADGSHQMVDVAEHPLRAGRPAARCRFGQHLVPAAEAGRRHVRGCVKRENEQRLRLARNRRYTARSA